VSEGQKYEVIMNKNTVELHIDTHTHVTGQGESSTLGTLNFILWSIPFS